MEEVQKRLKRRKPLTSGQNHNIHIRRANTDDLPGLKRLSDNNKHELGFIPRPALSRSIRRGHIFIGENSVGIVGFVDFYHRKDQQTTLYHIVVDRNYRKQGIGRALVKALIEDAQEHNKAFIQLKCPQDLAANKFYRCLGFEPVDTEAGKGRTLIVWRLSTQNRHQVREE